MLKIKYIEFLSFCIYLLFVVLSIKEFSIWPQITNLLIENDIEFNITTLATLVVTEHPHTLRVFLIFPIYVLAEFLFLDVKIVFSIVALFILFFSYYMILFIIKDYVSRKKAFLILIFLISISFFMNGRIMFSIFGNTLLLYLLYLNFYTLIKMNIFKKLFLYILAMWFVSVSSGTFMVFLLSVAFFYGLHFLVKLPYLNKKVMWAFLAFLLLLILIYPIIEIFIDKNLTYYDGSIINMLSHGIGKYLIKYISIIIPFFVLVALLGPIVFLYIKSYKILILPFSMMLASISVGLFGLSSLVSGMSAYLLFMYMFFNKKRIKR